MHVGPGTVLSHYRLIEKIGEGGMGVVWRAEDTRLERDVALKVLPAGVLSDEAARKRFRGEALALSKLNHPNIETIHDFDTQDGVDFLVMEYISGTSLDRKVATGPLTEEEVVRLGAQLVEGLTAAHEQGVLHRDLKPANLRVTSDGRLKILDFGLAKLLRPMEERSQAETATVTSGIVGTPPYMAPEQLRGEAMEARSDIWAVGVVLYELAGGQRPFRGETPTMLSDAILHQTPVTPRAHNAGICPDLERIVLKCLEKDPDNRYQSTKEIAVDLRRLNATAEVVIPASVPPRSKRWLYVPLSLIVVAISALIVYQLLNPPEPPTPGTTDGKIMLAVLPFENLSADPEQEYFSDGMTEEMIAHLGRLQPETLGVIARTSAIQYRNTTKQVDEIGRELGVQYLLEGSVRRAAGRVRITAQLVQVSDQTHLWAENYERDLADIFAVQNDVAVRVARSLALELLPAQQSRLASVPSVDLQVRDAYLKGRYYWNKRTPEGVRRGLEYFQKAIARDPNYAPAYAGIADSYAVGGGYYLGIPPKEAHSEARAAAIKAIELDDALAEAHATLANILYYSDRHWDAAEREFRRAIELNPNYATGHQWHAEYLSGMGRHEEAIAAVLRAQEIDPVSPIITLAVGLTYRFAGHYDEALDQIQKALELDDDLFYAYVVGARIIRLQGMEKETIAARQTIWIRAGNPRVAELLGETYRTSGYHDALQSELESLKRYVPSGYQEIASLQVALGDFDGALATLEAAVEERDVVSVWLRELVEFDPLRSDPRFQDLLRRVGLPTD